jgi:hypothetical protein
MREVDFLPEWYPGVRQRRRRVALQAWITMITIAGLGIWTLTSQRSVHAREVELASLKTDVNQSETEIQRLDDLLTLQRELGKQDSIFVKIGRPVATTKVMTTLDELMPRDMALLDLSLDTDETVKTGGTLAARAQQENKVLVTETKLRFRVHGVAPTDMDLAEFLAKLTGKSFFKQVELIYSHERQESGHVLREFEVAFMLDMTPTGGR